MNFFLQEFLKGVKGVKELSLPPVAEELRQMPWRKHMFQLSQVSATHPERACLNHKRNLS